MNKVLMIAFHYPPYQGSSGVLRTWNFTRYLRDFDWSPAVLTAAVRAYEEAAQPGKGGLETPADVEVSRAFALDAARHLSIKGRYPNWLALPDRWSSWLLPAVLRALHIVRRDRSQVIWSTFPIPTAHLVALYVQRLTGLPWVADFRDSMTEDEYPTDPQRRSVYRWIEQRVLRRAAAVVFTTQSTRRMYADRYSACNHAPLHVIPNGYDEEAFRRAELSLGALPVSSHGPPTLLHSGVLYPSERDPRPFLHAIGNLKRAGHVVAGTLRVLFRATAHDATIRPWIEAEDVADIVRLEPAISYSAALEEMLRVDCLLLFQAANSNHQIPAKLYEYLRSRRPIFGLLDAAGDTAAVLRSAGVDTIADIANAAEIEAQLRVLLDLLRVRSAPIADSQVTARYSRQSQAGVLAGLLHSVATRELNS